MAPPLQLSCTIYWSLTTLFWLLAVSSQAAPLATHYGWGFGSSVSTKRSVTDFTLCEVEALANKSGGGACHQFPRDITVIGRDITKGWFDRQEAAKLQKESEVDVSFFSLLDTLDPLGKLLDRNKIPWAVAGGLALKIHGQSDRHTTDIDMVVQTTMPKLRAALSKDKKYIVPGPGWPSEAHLRVYRDRGSAGKPRYIEIDLVIAGTMTTPESLQVNSKDFKVENERKRLINIHVMRLGKIFMSKVNALAAEHRKKDDKDMKDISWIIDKTPRALLNVQTDLSYALRQLVIKHLVRLKSPLVKKARQLLDVNGPARL
ncbi:unnamed protein product [Colletotrichum noveboracense]|uniref:Uncharacterized protein n=2 Tax=Colletotrichum gloeosporioides species complex TaxID=2707338 RepID=A0A9W4S3G1_9PEZI|nr:unnamed protein product [Colletotrichum noveboracense]